MKMTTFCYKFGNHMKNIILLTLRRLATTNFEPTYARWAFPCFDEPHLKAKFLMTVTHDRNLVAFFNSPKKPNSPSEVRGKPDQVKNNPKPLKFRFHSHNLRSTS